MSDKASQVVTVQRPGRSLTAFRHGDVSGASAVVICESGLGGDHTAWQAVIDHLGGSLPVVTYDRSGYGASLPASDERRLVDLAEDLLAVCDATSPAKPVILVGHSLGGRIVRAAAGVDHPLRLAGLVLVEAATDDIAQDFPKMVATFRRLISVGTVLGSVGVFRLRRFRTALAATRGFDPARVDGMIRVLNSRQFWSLMRKEWAAVSAPIPRHPPIAAPVISIRADVWKDWGARQTRLMGVDSSTLLQHMERKWSVLEQQYPRRASVLVTDTTHNIPADHPEVIVAAIRAVLEAFVSGGDLRADSSGR